MVCLNIFELHLLELKTGTHYFFVLFGVCFKSNLIFCFSFPLRLLIKRTSTLHSAVYTNKQDEKESVNEHIYTTVIQIDNNIYIYTI